MFYSPPSLPCLIFASMRGNSFGKLFRITTFGESHGTGIGVVIDGCPAGLEIDTDFIQAELARRKPGQSKLSTQRKESDEYRILSGVFEGKSLGTPIAIFIENQDAKSKDYSHLKDAFRPSHADFTWQEKFGFRDYRGGGRSSARETAARVAAGAIAKLLLQKAGVEISAYVSAVGSVFVDPDYQRLDLAKVEESLVRCPDIEVSVQMEEEILKARKDGDTVGGEITCVVKHCPAGWGEPVFDKLHADLAKAVMSINACKGFELGSGFGAAALMGSEHNDVFVRDEAGKIVTETNFSGGIQGGISNGMDIYFNAAFKPVATLMQDQESVDAQGKPTTIEGKGRHDPCVVPRAVPIVEAMTALVLADHCLRNETSKI